LRSQVEAGSNDAANPLGSSRRARTGLLITLVAALALAAVVLSSAAVADQLPVIRFGTPGSEAGQMRTPGGVAADPTSGDVYVADTGNNRIDKFSAEGTFILAFGWGVEDGSPELQTCETTCEFGLPGKGAGEMNEVVGVAVSPVDGDVYTVNRKDGRIQRFTPTGGLVEQFGGYGEGAEELGQQLPLLNDVATGPTGQVFVADASKSRVAVFGTDGKLASEISGVSVGAIAVGPTGLAYVANEFSEGVSVFEFEAGAWVFKKELLLRESFGAKALALNPANGNLIALVTSGFEASFAYALKEVNPAGALVATTKLPEIQKPPASSPQEISYGLAASTAAAFPEHEPGAVYVVDQVAGQVQALAEGEPQKPRISGLALSNLGSDFADLSAQLNPEGLPTEYLFEYGTTPGYGHTFPATPGQAAAGFEAITVGAHLTGLAPSTTYHFRLVATNTKGTAETLDQTFTTFPVGGPLSLPDGRAYEIATPLEKGHNDVEPRAGTGGGVEARGVAGNDEEGMAYFTLNGLPGSEVGTLEIGNVAKRGGNGWTSSVASGPELNQTTLALGAPAMIANDMNKALVFSKVPLAPGALPGTNLYIHTLSPSSYQLVTRQGYGGFSPGPVGASNDFSRVFFSSSSSLTPEAPPGESSNKLYEWDGSALHYVPFLPGKTTPFEGNLSTYGPELRPVSEDGSSVIFGAEEGSSQLQIYRRAGGRTVEVSAPNPGVVDPAGPQAATFVGAAADGSSVFFTSIGKLTDDANTGEGSGGEELAPNLYRYDVASGRLTDLTVDTTADERGAAVGKVVVAGSGNAAYFVAEGVLAAGGEVNQPNLYRWSQGGGVEFIAILSPSDGIAGGFEREAATNASGNAFAFVSTAGLAGRTGAAGIPEIYRYATGEGLACVSCGLGVMKEGAKMPLPSVAIGSGGGKPLSADGRKVFFTTADGLIPQDTNGKTDAYEWEGGVDSLLSTGTGNSNSYFVDASPSGKDVFISTRDRLVKADTDENIDVYDVREGGGFAEPPGEPGPCEAEACRPPLGAAPASPQLGSQSFTGPANKKHKHHKKKHHKKHKGKHHKGKAKHGKKSKSKAHSGGKRG
jgi:DNA-binding beta-propeller fold protein YncE